MSWWPFGKQADTSAPAAEPEKPKKKICCACPDTKVILIRDRMRCVHANGP